MLESSVAWAQNAPVGSQAPPATVKVDLGAPWNTTPKSTEYPKCRLRGTRLPNPARSIGATFLMALLALPRIGFCGSLTKDSSPAVKIWPTGGVATAGTRLPLKNRTPGLTWKLCENGNQSTMVWKECRRREPL